MFEKQKKSVVCSSGLPALSLRLPPSSLIAEWYDTGQSSWHRRPLLYITLASTVEPWTSRQRISIANDGIAHSGMGAGARGPKLPKRSAIERLTRKGPECLPEMMAMLSCFKDSNFNEARCAGQMRSLSECVSRQVRPAVFLRCEAMTRSFPRTNIPRFFYTQSQPEAKSKRKSTIFYHLKRLYYMQRR